MQFRCDRCGKKYSTSQEIREGRSYRFTCRNCGNAVIVRGQGTAAAAAPIPTPTPTPTPTHTPTTAATASPGLGPNPARPAGNGVPQGGFAVAPAIDTTPTPDGRSATPPGGYVSFSLDDDAVAGAQTVTARVPDPAWPRPVPPPPATPGSAPPLEPAPASVEVPGPGLEPPATAGGRSLPSFGRTPAAGGASGGNRRLLLTLSVVLLSAVLGGAFVALGTRGSRVRPPGGAAAPGQVPGLLKPVVYVGPVDLEQQGRPALGGPAPDPAPAAPASSRAPARREPPPPPPGRKVATRERPPARAASPAAASPARPVEEDTEVEEVPAPTPAPTAAAAAPTQPPPQEAPSPGAAVAPSPVAAAAARPASGAEEEAPAYARDGFRPPQPETPRCVENGIRIPRDLGDRLPSTVTLRFAVGRDGRADMIQVLGQVADGRIAEALRVAVAGCRFVPGADEQGRPTRLWVVMPLRFTP